MSQKYREPATAEASINELEQLYTFRKPEQVFEFITRHPELVPLLMEAHSKIGQHFPGAELFLRMFNDPETTNNANLLILIGSKYDSKETLKRLDQLDDDWWLESLDRVADKLSINVEFQ